MNPLNWTGPQFLSFFYPTLLFAVIVAFVLRSAVKRASIHARATSRPLDVYELAMLAGKSVRTLQTVLVGLVAQESIKSDGARQYRATGPLLKPLTPLKQEAHRFIAGGSRVTIRQIQAAVSDELSAIELRLVQDGLLLPTASRQLAGLLSSGVILLIVLLGMAKILVGLSRNRPVGILVLGCLIGGIAGAVFLFNTPWRTLAGDLALSEQKARSEGRSRTLELDPLLLSFAMIGPAELIGTPYSSLRSDFVATTGGDGGGSSCGSSGCGGGGCGGGGCGGCGGG